MNPAIGQIDPAKDPCRRIEADEIVLRSKDGKNSILLSAKEDSVGIWVTNGGDSVCICSTSRHPGPYVGVIHPENHGCPVAILISNGEAVIQLSDSKHIRHFSPQQLLELAKRV